MAIPEQIPNQIAGHEVGSRSGRLFEKVNPATGDVLWRVARSDEEDVAGAVDAARAAQWEWAELTPVRRGQILHDVAVGLNDQREDVARIVHLETGKPVASALEETNGAIALGLFMAGEGQRFYGRTTTSSVPNRRAMTVREPLGVAGLIVPANTPIANVAWKTFPALICGNAVVLKAAEDTPATAWEFARIAHQVGLPPGVLNVIQGYGNEAGRPLVAHPEVSVISFTGSSEVGREIAVTAGGRLARVSLELGGKNPFLVCDDADLEKAGRWAVLSAFSNAGQRCSSGSRILVFDQVYDQFRDLLVDHTKRLTVGTAPDADLGPVMNEPQLLGLLRAVESARERGATVLAGGYRMSDPEQRKGFFMAPTLIEDLDPHDELSLTELFGPVTCLFRVAGFEEGIRMANDSPYGLTACIHTRSLSRAMEFAHRVQAGVAVVNAGTFGSEPHMPFGGVKQSGNGWREPGTEALDVYSNLKDVYLNVDPDDL